MLQLINEIELEHCPCSIEFISKWNAFLVATYELDEQANEDERINKRHGSLAIINLDLNSDLQQNKHVQEFSCKNGGVFDFRLIDNDSDDCVHLYTAHSNGYLSYFKLIRLANDFKYEFKELKSLDTSSSMLTCLDLIVNNNSNVYVLTGDSCSTITIFKDLELISRIRISDFDYPIWSLKLMKHETISNYLLFTGSDDCVLRCLVFENEFQDHFQLFSDKSFEGGVTSIELEESETVSNYKVLVGSYDEKLRTFNLNLNQLDFSKRIAQPNCISLQKALSISNAGIWKVRSISPSATSFLLITGMYSGVHLVKDEQLIYSFIDLPKTNNDAKLENEHLVYGCCFNDSLDQLLITSFYKKKVYVLKTDKELVLKLKSK